jgi:hypothetical protein
MAILVTGQVNREQAAGRGYEFAAQYGPARS